MQKSNTPHPTNHYARRLDRSLGFTGLHLAFFRV
ncbi:hypothetical protein OF001_U110058 [Pseudomonas sp. OF001]|nr:hypothetical protein OF001_U110058 [Pseudomonas sp. OF001]